MRRLIFDQFEFEREDTEERLELAISRRSDFPHPNVKSFVEEAVGTADAERLSKAASFSVLHIDQIADHLQRFAGIDLSRCGALDVYQLPEKEDERNYVLDMGEMFISYRWSTSA